MEKLELKHLAPYLPYGLKIFDVYDNNIKILYTASLSVTKSVQLYKTHIEVLHSRMLEEIKPILHPISEKFVDSITEGFEDYEEILEAVKEGTLAYIRYNLFMNIVENHGDVFGLIDKGLAIDINTIK